MGWYTFEQNNSSGMYVPPAIYLIIEARTRDDAIIKATNEGVYFRGVEMGVDCDCCGDRWFLPYDYTDEPDIYGALPCDYLKETESFFSGLYSFDKSLPAVMLIYEDGTVLKGSSYESLALGHKMQQI